MDCGFATVVGQFTSQWIANETVFQLHITTPAGTTGTIGLPLPGNGTEATLTSDIQNGTIGADSSGRFWIVDVAGGEHEFVVAVA